MIDDADRIDAALSPPRGCPMCGSEAVVDASRSLPNLYSEKIAAMLGCDEASLLEAVPNARCVGCGVWYKPRWFKQDVLAALFESGVPTHPKGWDAGSRRFSKPGFLAECDAYRLALVANDAVEIARHRRGLVSIIESITSVAGTSLAGDLVDSIRQGDDATLFRRAAELPEDFGEPAAFRRFSGFSATALWNWMVEQLGAIDRYAEVGCPLWGQLTRAGRSGVACTHLMRTEANYWGRGCRAEGSHCREALVERGPVALLDWPDCGRGCFDVIGAFQYLDHLEDPVGFVAECFEAAPALLLILDGVDEPTAIQHRTGWNDDAIGWLGRRFGKRVHADLDAIRESGNRAWLLADA
jgi:hypothetical protein